eukprot:TRINITY_DN9436_c0_g1_i1.p1 TRINITY_DN9436_c0_g1~~TRINITY_DN9436_c0_g1_i1.p1  ORF type:complete len:318 (-),score=27.05 TRINITY_DN9436_c0_g1_i1:130-1083(-)
MLEALLSSTNALQDSGLVTVEKCWLTSAVLSIISSCIMALFLLRDIQWKANILHNYTNIMLLNMALADILTSVFYLSTSADQNNHGTALCFFQSFLNTVPTLTSILIMGTICLSFFILLRKKEHFIAKTELIRKLRLLFYSSLSVCWALPAFFFVLLMWNGAFGIRELPSGGTSWCWFKDSFKGWIYVYHSLVLIINIVTISTFFFLWSKQRHELGSFKRVLVWYLPASVLVYWPIAIQRFSEVNHSQPTGQGSSGLEIFAAITGPLQGFVNAVLYLIINVSKPKEIADGEQLRLLSATMQTEQMNLFGAPIDWSYE